MTKFFTKKKLPLIRVLSIEAMSSFVHQSLALAVPWYVIRTTGSSLWTAAVALSMMLPFVFGSTSGGMLAARAGATKTILLSESMQIALILCLAGALMGGAHVIIICALMFLISFLDAQSKVSRTALLPVYARLAKKNIHTVNGVREAIVGVCAILGPLSAGILIAFDSEVFVINILTVVYLFIFALALQAYQKREYSRLEKRASYFKKTFKYIIKRKILLRGILFSLPLFIVSFSWESVVLPSYIKLNNFDTVFMGAMSSAFGIGVLAGALFYAGWGKQTKFKTVLTANYIASVISMLVLFLAEYKFVVLGVTALCGAPFGAFSAAVISFVVSNAKEDFRTVTLGIFASLCAAVECVSVVGIGVAIDEKGFWFTLGMLCVIFTFLVICALLFYKDRKNSIIKYG